MTFHLPGKDFSSIGANADSPFSSWRLKPGLTPTTLNDSTFWPTVFMPYSLMRGRTPARGVDCHAANENDSYVRARHLLIQFIYSNGDVSSGLCVICRQNRVELG